jgi:3-hydroxyacyl-CoA dehydrogenase
MADVVEFEKHGPIAAIALNNPPVNALGLAVRQGLMRALEKAEADSEIRAIVIFGRGRGFSGGADIREFGALRPEPRLGQIIDRIEASAKPVIAAIHGMAMGGGCEVPLGCHYRVAAPDLRMGLPEVKLGLLPGAGGTQRLPRLIGIAVALDMIVGGDAVDAATAKKLGLVDAVIEGDLLRSAIEFVHGIVADGKGPHRTGEITLDVEGAEEIFTKARAKAAQRSRGLIAPERCIASVENATRMPLAEALEQERAYFAELEASQQSAALRHLFFAEREAHRIPGIAKDIATRPVGKLGVIGGGTMGRGIAMSFANAGLPVTIIEVSGDALEKTRAAIRQTYAGSVSRGSLRQAEMDAAMGLIGGATDYAALSDVDLVVEAVFEDMALKKRVFAEIDKVCKPGAILATNTSSLDIDEIAAATGRPQDVVGTHFFSPANVMKLMENVRGAETAPDVIATVMKLSKDIGKVGVLARVCDGFIGNRMLAPYVAQAEFLVEEGALPQQVDAVVYEFGFPMGPFAMGDLAGLDVAHLVREHRRRTNPSNERESGIIGRLVEMGRLGQKAGKGWYRYEPGSRKPLPDPQVEDLIVRTSNELGIERRAVSDQEIRERCIYPLINEAAKILEQGIAIRPSDIDLVWVHGYGFPRGKGGPMFYADTIGVATVYETMKALFEAHGEMLRPAPLLEELAKSGKSFADFQSGVKVG